MKPTITPNSFDGRLIYQRRQELGLSLQQVATFIGVKYAGTVHGWEVGRHRPYPEHLPNLAKALQVDVAYFFSPEDE